MNCIFSAYFVTMIDSQRGEEWSKNNFDIIQTWWQSVEKLGLNAIIFHDHLTDEFINCWKTKKMKFIYYKPLEDVLNSRFRCFYENLFILPQIKKIFCTDISDLIIKKNPFRLVKDNQVICGSENGLIEDSQFMSDAHERVYKKEDKFHLKEKILNCGIIGGTRNTILSILKKMVIKFNEIGYEPNSDMIIFNRIVYDNFDKENIKTGKRIHSKFYAKETNGNFYFKHK